MKKFNELVNNDKAVPECTYAPSVYSIFADHTLPMQVPGKFFDFILKKRFIYFI